MSTPSTPTSGWANVCRHPRTEVTTSGASLEPALR